MRGVGAMACLQLRKVEVSGLAGKRLTALRARGQSTTLESLTFGLGRKLEVKRNSAVADDDRGFLGKGNTAVSAGSPDEFARRRHHLELSLADDVQRTRSIEV